MESKMAEKKATEGRRKGEEAEFK